MTDCYDLTYSCGTLVILPRAITITAVDVSALYDGTVHTADEYTVDRLLNGHTIASVVFSGGASAPGFHEQALTVSDAQILDGEGSIITDRYEICYLPGDLTIEIIQVSEVKLSASKLYLKEGDSVKVLAEMQPADASLTGLIWHSDSNAVTVTVEGVITRLESGTAIVTAEATDGSGAKATITVYDDTLPAMHMPAAIVEIMDEAYANAPALRYVDLSATKCARIGANAFSGCTALEKVALPEGVAFDASAFEGCEQVVLYCGDEDALQTAQEAGIACVLRIDSTSTEMP